MLEVEGAVVQFDGRTVLDLNDDAAIAKFITTNLKLHE